MKKETIRQVRDKMIRDIVSNKGQGCYFWFNTISDWELEDIAAIFGLSLAQAYRIISKKENL